MCIAFIVKTHNTSARWGEDVTTAQPHGTTDFVDAQKDHSHMPQVATLESADNKSSAGRMPEKDLHICKMHCRDCHSQFPSQSFYFVWSSNALKAGYHIKELADITRALMSSDTGRSEDAKRNGTFRIFYSIKPYLKYKLICNDTTDDILSSVGVDAFKTMRKVEDEFTTEISENCAARKLRLFSLAGDVFSETEEKSCDKLMEIKKSHANYALLSRRLPPDQTYRLKICSSWETSM